MLRRNQKGQGLTEFALILPLLLLLLLGIIEASRVIWAYITVQNAAREAARFAVTGRPYLDAEESTSSQYGICRGELSSEPDPVLAVAQPWLCPNDGNNARVSAVITVAKRHGEALNVSEWCLNSNDYYGLCGQQPGSFGVLVEGQVTTQTVTGTAVITQANHAGLQGLNVQVSTFYNIEMMTPLYKVIMGDNYIKLQGRVQLQNEGLDRGIGIEPPPGIAPPPPPGSPGGGGYEPPAQIWSVSGYKVSQTDILRVHLKDHSNSNTYDIYLDSDTDSEPPFLICQNVTTGVDNEADADCPLLTAGVPAGKYRLYSTISGEISPTKAVAQEPVEVIDAGAPQILIEDGNIWAANTPDVKIKLLFHEFALNKFDVKLYDKDENLVQTIATGITGAGDNPISWTVYDMAANGKPLCDQTSGAKCTIRSFKEGETDPNAYEAITDIQINQATIELSNPGADGSYARGEQVLIFLYAHTPNKRYNVKVQGETDSETYDTLDTNGLGDTTVLWKIPDACGGFGTGWTDGSYTITSHPMGGTAQIAIKKDVVLKTPSTPYLTIDKGDVWPAGSSIDIRVHKHAYNQTHYLEFDGLRIPTQASDDTFVTGDCGEALIPYEIPVTTTEGTHTIASFDSSGDKKAEVTVEVLKEPIIQVVEGSTVLPNETITIELFNHNPNFSYRIILGDKELFAVVKTDGLGRATVTYDLEKMPPPRLASGEYILQSQVPVAPYNTVAKTKLKLQPADLAVTNVEVPDTVQFDTNVPITLTIKNLEEVPIDRWVDIDFYVMKHPEPDPIGPSYQTGRNFPGDIKYWKDTVAPLEEFKITTPFSVTEYGLQTAYGFVDASNYVFEDEGSGEIANPNNVRGKAFLVPCAGSVFVDEFNDPGLPDWQVTTYGNGDDEGYQTKVESGSLFLNNSGSSNWISPNDNAAGMGELFFYRDTPLPSESGLEVMAKLTDVELKNEWSMAGIEIRNSVEDPTSAKVILPVVWRKKFWWGSYYTEVMPSYRNTDTGMGALDHISLTSSDPVWLRIERVSGTKTFKFYYKQTNASPPPLDADATTKSNWWGSSIASVTVSTIDDEVYVGLFNVPWSSQAGTAEFDYFSLYPDPTSCATQQGETSLPPGYQTCTPVLKDRSFEKAIASSEWTYWRPLDPYNGVAPRNTDTAHSNNFSVKATTQGGYNPYFFQKFTMPDWVISTTTTFDLKVYKNIRSYMPSEPPDTSPQKADKFYAVIATTGNPATWELLTDPKDVTNGVSTAGFGAFSGWAERSVRLDVATDKLEDYAGQELYLYLYNDSNLGSPVCPGGCETDFYFDDADLTTCTSEPLPSTISTRITGRVTLTFGPGASEAREMVKVWAYAPDGKVYETFTIQNGEFNFYNLPASDEGITYIIFAQYYHKQGEGAGAQMLTLAGDTSILLTNNHTNDNPAQAFLDLFVLPPLP